MKASEHRDCAAWECPELHKPPPPPKRLRGYAALAAAVREAQS